MSADISPCGRYRYQLRRLWDPAMRSLTFVMLNPSTADDDVDDPTIRRCMGFARRDGAGGLLVVNLFAYRATDPADLRDAEDAVGPKNAAALSDAVRAAAGGPIVCAWGARGARQGRSEAFLRMGRETGGTLVTLGTTKEGHPKHPLYVRADQPFLAFPAARR